MAKVLDFLMCGHLAHEKDAYRRTLVVVRQILGV
jgi:hypothetical protein